MASNRRPSSTCEYVEKKQIGTPKFDCAISPDDKIRVKYGEENGEIYSEVAASRLLWALGFGADRVYPVKVVCKGCPADPMKTPKKAEGTREFAAAIVERKLAGDEIELGKDSGWAWVELNFVDQTSGGAPLAHRDALKLLAAMIQHTDTKPQQQRLVCLDKVHGMTAQEDGNCTQPFMMINDLGKTFGQATLTNADKKSAVNFEAWSSTPIWKDDEGLRRPAVEVVHRLARAPENQRERTASSSQSCCRSSPISSCGTFSKSRVSPSAIRRCRSTIGSACSNRSATRSRTPAARIQFFSWSSRVVVGDFSSNRLHQPPTIYLNQPSLSRPASRVTRLPRLPDRFSPA